MARRLIESEAGFGFLLDQQEAVIATHHRSHGDIGFPDVLLAHNGVPGTDKGPILPDEIG